MTHALGMIETPAGPGVTFSPQSLLGPVPVDTVARTLRIALIALAHDRTSTAVTRQAIKPIALRRQAARDNLKFPNGRAFVDAWRPSDQGAGRLGHVDQGAGGLGQVDHIHQLAEPLVVVIPPAQVTVVAVQWSFMVRKFHAFTVNVRKLTHVPITHV